MRRRWRTSVWPALGAVPLGVKIMGIVVFPMVIMGGAVMLYARHEILSLARPAAYYDGLYTLLTQRLALTLGVLTAAGMALALGLSYALVRPLRQLLDVIRRVEGGDLSARVPVWASDEIGQVQGAFNRMTGELEQSLNELARRYATTRPARIFTLYGIDRWHHGATFGRLIATLAALTGNVGIPGGGAGVDGFCEGALFVSDFTFPDGQSYRPINPAGLPGQILSGQPHPIKAVIVAFNNWLNQWPDQTRMCQDVLPRLDLLVTADHFMTETARWSDYVLPAAMLFEREDMVKGPGPYIQYQPAILTPPGDCRSDLAIAAGLADRLGLGAYFARPAIDYLDEVLASAGPETAGLSALDLREQDVLRKNVPDEPPVAHAERRFATPTGRIEFYVERLLPFGRALPDYEPPVEADPSGRLARRFPLVCLTEHSRYRVHSTFGNVPWLRELDREPDALLHPSEARARGIAGGDLIRIFNDRGYVVLRARLSQATPPGAVYLSRGWQSRDFLDGHPQTLTHDRANPANAMGPNCSFSDVLVEVVKERQEHVPR